MTRGDSGGDLVALAGAIWPWTTQKSLLAMVTLAATCEKESEIETVACRAVVVCIGGLEVASWTKRFKRYTLVFYQPFKGSSLTSLGGAHFVIILNFLRRQALCCQVPGIT